jgi:hypothetical protein
MAYLLSTQARSPSARLWFGSTTSPPSYYQYIAGLLLTEAEAVCCNDAVEAGTAVAQVDQLTPSQKRTLHHVQMLSKVMDSAVGVPGTNFRFGLDAMIGLVPFAGKI